MKKVKSVTGKYLKDVVLIKLNRYSQKRRPVTGSNMSGFYMIMPQPLRLPLLHFFFEKKEVTFTTPYSLIFTRPCPFLFFSEIGSLPRWAEISVPQVLGSAVYWYLTSINKLTYHDAYRKWIHQLKVCVSSH